MADVDNEIAFFGGQPVFDKPMYIVRPRMPDPIIYLDKFQAAVASGIVTNNGPWVQQFERELTAYIGAPTAAFSSGQTALMTMLHAADIVCGEVIVPSFTFSATPHAVTWAGGLPVFADILDDGSFCIDPEDVERRITPNTRAILGVDAYGLSCDYAALDDIGRRHGLKVFYDSAPSFGSRVDGKLVGGHGDGQMFSFHATKAFATMEGGCISSNNAPLMERIKALRNFGQDNGADCSMAGLNGKMLEVCALIGIEQLKVFEHAARIRRTAVERMIAGIERLPGLSVSRAPAGQDPIWLYLPIVVEKAEFGVDRELLAAALEKEQLFVRKYYSPPCHHMGAYARSRDVSLPVTEHAAYNVIALPVYNDMTECEADGVVAAFTRIHANVTKLAASVA